jgi:hypothetical protein
MVSETPSVSGGVWILICAERAGARSGDVWILRWGRGCARVTGARGRTGAGVLWVANELMLLARFLLQDAARSNPSQCDLAHGLYFSVDFHSFSN